MIRTVPDTGTAATIPLSSLILRPQIRTRNGFDQESLSALAASIRANGVLQPILVAPAEDADRYFLIAGERRVLAAAMAGLDELPALVRTGPPSELATMQAVENLQRQDLALLDLADGLRALRPAYKSSKALAQAIGKSTAWVSKHLALTRLSPVAHAIAAEHCADLEIILLVDQIARLPATDRTITAETRCMAAAQAGTLTRTFAQRSLDYARATPPTEPETPTADDEQPDLEDDAPDEQPEPETNFRAITLHMPRHDADHFERLGGLHWLLTQLAQHA